MACIFIHPLPSISHLPRAEHMSGAFCSCASSRLVCLPGGFITQSEKKLTISGGSTK